MPDRLVPLLVALASLSSAVPAAAATEVPRVGVVVTLRVNVPVEEADVLADRLGEALRQKLVVDVIAGSETTRRLADANLPEDCVAQPACIAMVAQRLDASELIFLVVVSAGGAVQIDPTWVDVATGRTAAREAILIDESERLPERVFPGRATGLLPHVAERKTEVIVIPGGGEQSRRHMTRGAWIALVVSGVALAGGLGFGAAAWRTNSALEADRCDVFACDPDRVDTLETQLLAADVLFGVAALAGGTALYLWVRSDRGAPAEPPKPTGQTSVSAFPAPGGVLVQAVMRW